MRTSHVTDPSSFPGTTWSSEHYKKDPVSEPGTVWNTTRYSPPKTYTEKFNKEKIIAIIIMNYINNDT